jgi:hypothetical protein
MFNYTNSFDIYISLIKSLFFINGLFTIGKFTFKYFDFNSILNFKYIFLQYILIGSIIISFFIYYLYFLFNLSHLFVEILTYLIISFGFLSTIFNYKKNISILEFYIRSIYNNSYLFLIFILFILFFIISISPITNADTLDYHFGFANLVFKNSEVINRPDWFHISLSGISEYLLILSISINSEQIGNVLQFFGLVSIAGILLEFKYSKNYYNLILLLLSSPVLLFLITSSKPQLTSIALSCLIFCALIKSNFANFKFKHFIFLFFLIIYLSLTKLNFVLTSTLFIIILFQRLYKFKNVKKIMGSVFLFLFATFLIYLPYFYYKSKLADNILDYILPIPKNIPGSNIFLNFLINYKDSNFVFPLSLIIPSELSNFTTIIGINLIVLIYIIIKYKSWEYNYFYHILIFILLSIFLGQNTSRFFLEPFCWFLIFISININDIKFNKYIYALNIFNYLMLSLILIYTTVSISIGSININLREKVLLRSSNGYDLSKWTNKLLSSNTNLLLDHRSSFYFKQNIYSADWIKFSNNNNVIIDNYYASKNINYVLIVNNDPKKSKLYKYCKNLAFGPYPVRSAFRNPFSKNVYTNAWIYHSSFIK